MTLVEHISVGICKEHELQELQNAMHASYTRDEQWYETAESLIDFLETEINSSAADLSENISFKRIIGLLIGFRTVRPDPFSSNKAIFLTKNQLASIDSDARVQFIHGGKGVGKTTTLIAKLWEVARQVKGKSKIYILAATEANADRIQAAIKSGGVGGEFSINWQKDKNETGHFDLPYKDIAQLNCEWLFIDDVTSVSLNARLWLEGEKPLHLICTLQDDSIHTGLQHSSQWFQWIHLARRDAPNEPEMEKSEYIALPCTDIKTTKNDDYFSISMSKMNSFYPDWTKSSSTICIPVCLDLIQKIQAHYSCKGNANEKEYVMKDMKNNENDKADYGRMAMTIGNRAEAVALQAFQRLNLGGVVVAGFRARLFWKKVRDRVDANVQMEITSFLEQCDFESDILFFHPRLGIYVIEVKGKKNVTPQSSSYKRAKEQLDQMVTKKIPELFRILTDRELTVPISGAICFPNADLSGFPIASSDWLCIDRNQVLWEEDFRLFWQHLIEKNSDKNTNYFEETAFQRFIYAMVAYRSSAVISHAINALEIYDILDTQNFLKHDISKMLNDVNESASSIPIALSSHRLKLQDDCVRTFFLNHEQLAIYEYEPTPGTIEIIFGPPGTGKTLLIMLKALKAAKEQRPGRVMVKTRPSLVPKLRQILKANSEQGTREIVVLDAVVDNEDDADDDDYFADEFEISLDRQKIFQRRLFCKGRTVVAITGAINTIEITNIRKTLQTIYENECAIHELRTVVRGTKSIVDFWKADLHEYSLTMSMGHTALGRCVDIIRHKTSSAILDTLLEIVESFIKARNEAQSSKKIVPKDIAIVVSDPYSVEIIKCFLAIHSIPCGSAEEQLSNQNLVAIEHYIEALSYEWPIVLAVDFLLPGSAGSFRIIASSRAIAHLVYVERDHIYVQTSIDQYIAEKHNAYIALKSLMELYAIVQVVSTELGEQVCIIYYYDYLLYVARSQFVPQSLQAIEPLKGCANLFNLLDVLTINKYILRSVATKLTEESGNGHNLASLHRRGRGRAIFKYEIRSSKLFNKLFTNEEQQRSLTSFLKEYGKVSEELTCEQDKYGSIRTVFYSDEEDNILLQLGKCSDWDHIIRVIELICNSCTCIYYYPSTKRTP